MQSKTLKERGKMNIKKVLCIFATMKKVVFLILGLFAIINVFGERKASIKENNLRAWKADGVLGLIKTADIDTLLNGYNITNDAYKRTIAFQHLGNYGSAGQSKIFKDRIERSDFIFFQPYSLYYTAPEDLLYYNTKRPYANISYYNGGPSDRKQENLNGIFSVNVTHNINVGMYGKWGNNYGSYNSQSTRNYNAGFFGSWMGDHNNLMANLSFNGYEQEENGGFTDSKYITDPKNTGELDGYNIPTYFDDDVTSKLVNWNAYLNYKYNFGYYKEKQVTEDSVAKEFVPVSSIIYTFRNESDYRRYLEDEIGSLTGMSSDSFYINKNIGKGHKINNSYTRDSVHYWEMSHTAGISLNEEFNTIGKFGLAGYLSYTQKQYGIVDHIDKYSDNESLVKERDVTLDEYGADSIGRLGKTEWNNTTKTKVGLGAILSKHHGEHLQFDFQGEYFFKDEKNTAGTYKMSGDLSSKFELGRNQFLVKAHALHERYCPDYFEEHYFGNRLSWDNDFDNKIKTEIEGTIGTPELYLYGKNDSSFLSKLAPKIGLTVTVNETDLSNYVYWSNDATPKQSNDNISITNVTLGEQLKIWYLHWDNEITYQYTNADENVLDLPTWSIFSNAYFLSKPLFKVLTLQIGADIRYNSKYYAPAYMPATGMFYNQNEVQIGDYPYWEAYINMHLKSFRLFVEYNHINNLWTSNHNYLATPGYALDQNYFKFGISVNFDN